MRFSCWVIRCCFILQNLYEFEQELYHREFQKDRGNFWGVDEKVKLVSPLLATLCVLLNHLM